MLDGLAIYPPVANFIQCICAKNYENWLAVDKVIAKIIRLTFFGPPCRCAVSAMGHVINYLRNKQHNTTHLSYLPKHKYWLPVFE